MKKLFHSKIKIKKIEYYCNKCHTQGISLDLNKNKCPYCDNLLIII
jgi:Zn finger protein HypA/HybF involved in hydrogenase expression